MSAHNKAQTVDDAITQNGFNSPCAAFRAAGGITISEGNGINELSITINIPTVQ